MLLIGLPAGAIFASYRSGWVFSDAGVLAATFGLFASALVMVYTVLAGWHTKLEAEPGYRRQVTGRARRSMREAVAHALLCASVSVVAAVLATVLASTPASAETAARAISAALSGLGAYAVLTFLIVVNLLVAAHDNAVKGAERESQEADRRERERQRHS